MSIATNLTTKAEGCTHNTMSGWNRRKRQKGSRASQTPGKLKNEHCQLTSIGGQPRKYWIRSRSYKHRNYATWVEFSNAANKGA